MVGAIGLNLRAPLGSVPPLLGSISAELHLSGSMQGLITSVGVVFMGLCAPLGQRVAARYGSEVTTAVFLGVLAVGGMARLVATSTAVLFLCVAVAGTAMGAISALVPGLVGHHLTRIKGTATGIYSTGLALGVAMAAWVAVPSAQWLGGWRPALALWGLVAAVTAIAWSVLLPRLRHRRARVVHEEADEEVAGRGLPWRSRTAWWVTVFSSAQMVIAALGVSVRNAAYLFVFFQLIQLVAMMTLPAITDFTRDRRPLLALTVVATCAGVLMMIVAPVPLALPAVGLFGLGVGGGSALVLVLISDYTSNQLQAARLGAMTLMIAFLVGALGPVVLGVLHDLTGSFRPGYAVMLALATALVLTVPAFRPGRTLD